MDTAEQMRYAAYWSRLMREGFISGKSQKKVIVDATPGELSKVFGEGWKPYYKALQVFIGVLTARLGYNAQEPSIQGLIKGSFNKGTEREKLKYTLIK